MADEYVYELSYYDADGKRKKPQFTDEDEAIRQADLIAARMARGDVESAGFSRTDRDELLEIRRACSGTPALSAVREWAQAHELTGGQVLAAAQAFAAKNGKGFSPIQADQCVVKFINAMDASGGEGSATYTSKLKPIKTHFVGRELHTISTPEWSAYLDLWKNGVTSNDIRKRTTSMCLWARRQGFLPRGVELEISHTTKKKEEKPQAGIIKPDVFGKLLQYLRTYHPHHLSALVVTGFMGVRADEVHGKKKDGREKRQVWKDIKLDERLLLTVTNVKENTPAWRTVPICPAAADWLKLCPLPHEGPICEPAALERVREIGINAGLDLPDNCFRHSYISYQVVLTGNKPQVSTWAGNSVTELDRRYRRPVFADSGESFDTDEREPVTKKIAESWFGMTPELAEKLPAIIQKTPAENGRAGGLVTSDAKTAAVTANAEKARAAKLRGVGAAPADPIL